ncbi:MerR family transcriptional regulator [Listeria weihenstephanensis FSL R9-0317]|uniref:MerR family transcriptional regulator n=1 Tax=Listeria weihenstephanensis TaxID=1006155 RepID=A0A1S7FS64_9LIST|nr:MerR family transcriptional regulator [Listeria weihenstephanensis]AQY50217.1 MerR family transcriptional regulator [Listeria weihenstephanensis]EUJ39381.1 MerR family transcriptional regulator [Listeria weihenstephanensis FSL R9-0317]
MTYSIKEVSELFGLSIYTIRFYDKQGLLPFVAKNESGHREFTVSDLSFIQTICCLKNTGMQIKDIRKYIDFCMEGTSTIDSRKTLLSEHREQIMEQIVTLNENLKEIDAKLDVYSSPDAVEIISAQRKFVNDEKRELKLASPFAGDSR